MKFRKIYVIAVVLAKSQLRAGRSGRARLSFFRRSGITFYIDLIAFAVTAGFGYFISTFFGALNSGVAGPGSAQLYSAINAGLQEGLLFIPAFVPSAVLIAGLLFELNVSSKFSASDTVNWLPVTQAEYVLASILSVAYNYSLLPCVVLGFTLPLSFAFGYPGLWAVSALFSFVTLFMGGTFVEILRATINRVSSIVLKRARRGALLFRLALIVVIIVVFDTVFNPEVLLTVANTLKGTFSVVAFVPVFWGSAAVGGIENGDALSAIGFSVGTFAFTAFLVWVAIKVRSRYWSPVTLTVTITSSEYVPRSGFLTRLGLTTGEAAIVRKDFRGLTRRRELLSYLAIPIVFIFIFLIEGFSTGGGTASGTNFLLDFPSWFAGSLFALLISSISFGQESKSVMVLYSLPVSAMQILKAKAFVALSFALTATLATFIIFSLIEQPSIVVLLENLAIAVSITIEETFLGLGFGAAHPDFQERPRPRFVDPVWLLVMTFTGIGLAFLTAVPIIYRDIVLTLPGSGTVPLYFFPAAVALATVVAAFSYLWAKGSVKKLMSEYRI